MKKIFFLFFLVSTHLCFSQIPVEVSGGNSFIATDIQWLQPFENGSAFIFYSRSRYTVDYNNHTDYFISGIIAYGLKSGIGPATEILANGEGMTCKIGVQYLKSDKYKLIYIWLNAGYNKEVQYSLFTIFRLLPALNDKIRLYTQLELASSFDRLGNVFSAVRPRIGLSIKTIQFGLAGDFSSVSPVYLTKNNLGLFLRKEF